MYKPFNDMASDFFTTMESYFPTEQKIKTYRMKYEMLKYMNQRQPVEMFMSSLRPFGSQILSKDEMFFKQEELVNNAESISGKMGLIQYWDSLNSVTKNTIWEYMQGLYIMGMASMGLQEELQKLIKITNFQG